jgi:spermidine synthase
MPRQLIAILFVCFFLSGFCGLLYQIVWLRLAYASFGIVTAVLSVVVSTFMAGLSIGSVLGGKMAVKLSRGARIPAIQLYGITELFIGLGAVSVPFLYGLSEQILLRAGASDSFGYLALSAVCIAASLLPWCILMGCTYPLMLAFTKQSAGEETSFFGFLYWANVMGATVGVLSSAFVLIEMLGFRNTLVLGAVLNGAVAGLAFYVARKYPVTSLQEKCDEIAEQEASNKPQAFALILLFLTGFCSMAMEVIWSRTFMPVLGTAIYSFALLLFVYLLSTALGSHKYLSDKKRGAVKSVNFLVCTVAFCAFLPILLNGFQSESIYTNPNFVESGVRAFVALFSIAPLCFFLGYLTPKLIDDTSAGLPEPAGSSYAINSIGCIVGPFVASYVLLPSLGARIAQLVLVAPMAVAAIWRMKQSKPALGPLAMIGGGLALLMVVGATVCGSYDEPRMPNAWIHRDHVATVLVYSQGGEQQLLVNGRRMTNLRPFLKMMAHYPIVLHKGPVKSSLVICLGMGTTYRSLLSWEHSSRAVELVPGVKAALGNFYRVSDADFQNIIVDDGRRYLNRSNEKFDLITIDPPPPVEAAGSSLLYSKEFCEVLKNHLNAGGILQQWFPSDEKVVLIAVARALKETFPYVRVFQSSEGWGYHVLCSEDPVEVPSLEEIRKKLSPKVLADIAEGAEPTEAGHPEAPFKRIIESEIPLSEILDDKNQSAISDDRPINEYCLVRRIMEGKPEEWNSVKVRKASQ